MKILVPLLIVELFTDEVRIRMHSFHRLNHHVCEAKDDARVRLLFFPCLLHIGYARVQSGQIAHKFIVNGVVEVFLGLELFLALVDLGDELGDRAVEVCVFCVVTAVGDDVLSDELVVEF